MLPAYLSLSPVADVNFCRSLPAKSTKCSFGVLIIFPFPYYLSSIRIDKEIVKMLCERDDYRFIMVSPTCRFFIPVYKHYKSFYELKAVYSVKFSTKMPRLVSCLIANFFYFYFLGSIKSKICSLQSSKQLQVTEKLSAFIAFNLINNSRNDLCIIPLSSPIMVCVFPEPVCPYTKIQPLYPSIVFNSKRCPIASNISVWVALTENILSNAN